MWIINDTDLARKIEDSVFSHFLNGLSTRNDGIFEKSRRWAFSYYYLRELCTQMQKNGVFEGFVIKFSVPRKEFDINYRQLFYQMNKLHEELFKKINKRNSGMPTWFKKLKFEGKGSLTSDIKRIINKLLYKLLTPIGASALGFIKNQDNTFATVKGSLKKDRVESILKLIDYRTMGLKSKRQMEYSFLVQRARKLYNQSMVEFTSRVKNVQNIDTEWKKTRITLKKCIRFILYWGLLGTIQFRLNRDIEVSSAKEQGFFGFCYKILRDSMVKLNYIECTDPTYCINLRCKSFKVNVFMPKELKIKANMELNNLEKQYISLKESDYFGTMYYGEVIDQYVNSRVRIVDFSKEIESLNSRIKKTYFALKNKKRNINYSTILKLKMLRDSNIRDIRDFKNKYSNSSYFDWNRKLTRIA